MLNFNLEAILQIVYVFFFVVLGVWGKDYLDTINGKDVKIYIQRIIIMSILITVFMLGFKEKLLEILNEYFYLFLCSCIGYANYSFLNFFQTTGEKIVNYSEDKVDELVGKDKDDKDDE